VSEAAGTDFFRRRAAWQPLESVFWLAALASVIVFPGRLLLINDIAILGLFAVSLDLVLGFAGILTLGHAAFFGVGAYAAGLVALAGPNDPLLCLAAGAVAACLIGLATSFLILRGSDLTRLMITVGVASIILEIANRSAITGGANGLSGIAVAPILGLFPFDLYGHAAAGLSLVVAFLLFLLARRLVASPFGQSLRAVKENRLRAGALGMPANRRLVAIYALSAAYAGTAGALLAVTTQFVSLDVLAFRRSAEVLLALILGGAGWLYGGLIGAAVLKLLQDQFASLTAQYSEFWLGLILVAIVLIGRDRLAGLWQLPWPRRR
jgi:branched-chain amino acid transport system permease protein